ncbi:LytTR family DNA-binding domain-containing protein [Paenibacillus sp. FSL H8-0457]|uniref:LytR/AlgR family response regulator transcription factor n=1 Tax=Bacillales TaxID=1385 RepID=UPI0003E212FA|nr:MULTISPECIES: LytTR family DNA-binding domain-containing protein [Paenibacillus]ETT69216.1 LytTR family two component transcriptional regulator [Paenibacillus sp. FSL H8-457]PCL91342.1 DNA-binding response regulator [Paenibacillus lautus]QOT09630.1 response regulator transcription factor [Paenibacillus sp. JNUCC-32]WFB58360.1 LytTR family DNA-binding domain-containing protein [Paenibacillus sp. BR1-192]GIP07151.1 DNA-binding response regulator [Paenibacillus lautus]
MKRIKTMIAEDERLAREELAYLLEQEPDIELLPHAANGRELLELVPLRQPDVVFLDVHMPELEGLQAARMLKASPISPLIVFTTAYDEYAVEAFGLNAIDYLLKPYSHMRLKETLQRIRSRIQEGNAFPKQEAHDAIQAAPYPSTEAAARSMRGKLLFDDGDKHVLVDPEAILYAVREERVIRVWTAEGQRITSKSTLQELEEKLAGYSFFRPHRSYLVNVNWIAELSPWQNGAYNIVLKDEQRSMIPLSREAARDLFRLLREA